MQVISVAIDSTIVDVLLRLCRVGFIPGKMVESTATELTSTSTGLNKFHRTFTVVKTLLFTFPGAITGT